MQTNEGTYDESLLLIMERHGYPEETCYTFSYSPVPADDGRVGGIICANTDDTQRIIGERQVKLLRTLAAEMADARTIEETCRLSANSLAQNPADLPFAMLYLLDQEQQRMACVGTTGIPKEHPAAPATVLLADDRLWPFQEVMRTGKAVVIADLGKRFEQLPTGAWKHPPHHAVVVPIALRVAVQDHGPGLTIEQQARLFERFFRVPGMEQQSGSGMGLGLGLSMCKTSIERHGGQVGVESSPGVGSTFWFALPLAR